MNDKERGELAATEWAAQFKLAGEAMRAFSLDPPENPWTDDAVTWNFVDAPLSYLLTKVGWLLCWALAGWQAYIGDSWRSLAALGFGMLLFSILLKQVLLARLDAQRAQRMVDLAGRHASIAADMVRVLYWSEVERREGQ